jgi:hypothetical protein
VPYFTIAQKTTFEVPQVFDWLPSPSDQTFDVTDIFKQI